VSLISYDSSTDANEAIAHGARMSRGQRATVLTIWSPFDTAALGLSGASRTCRRATRPAGCTPSTCYLSFSSAAIAAGVAATQSNLRDASLGYAAFVGALSAIAVASALGARSSHKRTAGRVGMHESRRRPAPLR
jgi:hypothetical protein